MVLTVAQTTAFFSDNAQMGIPAATVTQMADEGIRSVDDLLDFDKDTIDQMANNLRRPPGGVNAFAFGARSQKRLLAATKLVRFYDTIGRPLTQDNIQWTPVMQNFEEQWKALEDRKEEGDPDTPLISKSLPIIKWTEAFKNHLTRCIGVRHCPLLYVVRENANVLAPCPALEPSQPYSQEHGFIEEDPD